MKVTPATKWAIGALLWPVLVYAGAVQWPGPGLPPVPPERLATSRVTPLTPAAGSRLYFSGARSVLQFWSDPQSGEVHLTIELPPATEPMP